MKRFIVFFLMIAGVAGKTYAQNIKLSPTVISTQGQNSKVGNFGLSWTMGQPFSATSTNGNLKLTQGFQQIEVPKAPGNQTAKRICSDSTENITFRNVIAGNGGNRIEWALNNSFTGSHFINSGDSITVTVNSGNVDTVWLRSRIGTSGTISAPVKTTASVLPPIGAANKITVINDLCGIVDTIRLGGINITGTYTFQWQNSMNGVDFADVENATGNSFILTNPQLTGWFRRILYQAAHCEKYSNKLKPQ